MIDQFQKDRSDEDPNETLSDQGEDNDVDDIEDDEEFMQEYIEQDELDNE